MKPTCPGCKVEMHRAGFQFSGRHRVQRYKCNQCGYAATETNKNIWRDTMKRKLTDSELIQWGERLNPDNDWGGVDVDMVYRLMTNTAGNSYDVGECDWDFDKSDAERMLKLFI